MFQGADNFDVVAVLEGKSEITSTESRVDPTIREGGADASSQSLDDIN